MTTFQPADELDAQEIAMDQEDLIESPRIL